ncbi:MAG: PQQ-dependent sugar dehydrogenase [Bacteroidota bacterium]
MILRKNILLFLFSLLLCNGLFAQSEVVPELVASGYASPVDIAEAGDDRLFVVEQEGFIRILKTDGTKVADPFLDLRDRVHVGGTEQGLLGLAFHPDYESNPYFFVHYIVDVGNSGTSRISRFQADPQDPNKALKESEKIILELAQPFRNHNGGGVAFGPDGYLYIGFGDGGDRGDPLDYAQDPLIWHGKMLRIDIDTEEPYAIPPDNPFEGTDFELDEIWAFGLRNPWRFSFDRLTGDMWIADVGQNAREEIDFQPANSTGGENYGWDCREGELPYSSPADECADEPTVIEPVHTYKVSSNCNSVTGGYVYRGCRYPEMYGRYFYAEFCQGYIWSLRPDGSGGWINDEHFRRLNYDISTFGEDVEGELYVARWRTGDIYRLTMGDALAVPDINQNGSILSVVDTFSAYQWYQDGAPIAGATMASYTAAVSGDYTLVVTYDNGCTFETATVNVLVTSVDAVDGVVLLGLQPNPSNGRFDLQLDLPEFRRFGLQLVDIHGRTLLEEQHSGQGSWQRSLQLGHLPDGLYYLRVQTAEGYFSRSLLKLSN